MKHQSWLFKLLKMIGIVKEYEVSKKEMCDYARSICDENCVDCAWNEKSKEKE